MFHNLVRNLRFVKAFGFREAGEAEGPLAGEALGTGPAVPFPSQEAAIGLREIDAEIRPEQHDFVFSEGKGPIAVFSRPLPKTLAQRGRIECLQSQAPGLRLRLATQALHPRAALAIIDVHRDNGEALLDLPG